mgnify:CR=1 FL=1
MLFPRLVTQAASIAIDPVAPIASITFACAPPSKAGGHRLACQASPTHGGSVNTVALYCEAPRSTTSSDPQCGHVTWTARPVPAGTAIRKGPPHSQHSTSTDWADW